MVDRLLQDPRVNPATKDNYALTWAAAGGHLVVVERLLQDKRVDPSARKNSALKHALRNNHFSVAKRLKQDPRVAAQINIKKLTGDSHPLAEAE